MNLYCRCGVQVKVSEEELENNAFAAPRAYPSRCPVCNMLWKHPSDLLPINNLPLSTFLTHFGDMYPEDINKLICLYEENGHLHLECICGQSWKIT